MRFIKERPLSSKKSLLALSATDNAVHSWSHVFVHTLRNVNWLCEFLCFLKPLYMPLSHYIQFLWEDYWGGKYRKYIFCMFPDSTVNWWFDRNILTWHNWKSKQSVRWKNTHLKIKKIADKLNFVEAKYTVNESSSMYFNTLVILILRNVEDLIVIYAS